jgi:hypothetical protein
MVRFKVPSVRVVVFFVFVLFAVLALMQAHLTQAQPVHSDAGLKTIANIVVHAHHSFSHAAQ